MDPQQGVAISPLTSEMPNGGAHLVLSEVRKQQLDGFSSNCLAAPLKSKIQILPSKPDIQVNTYGVSTQFPNFQTDLGSLDLSSRENVMEQTFGCRFAFPCECGDPPNALRLRGNCT